MLRQQWSRGAFRDNSLKEETSGRHRGFKKDRQLGRRQIDSEMVETVDSINFQERRGELLRALGVALQDPIAHFISMDMKLPLNDSSLEAVLTVRDGLGQHEAFERLHGGQVHPDAMPTALRRSGSQPSVLPSSGYESVSAKPSSKRYSLALKLPLPPAKRYSPYKEILLEKGLITLPHGHTGRKPKSNCIEASMMYFERRPDYDWASWWIREGGFEAPFVIDKCILAILDMLD